MAKSQAHASIKNNTTTAVLEQPSENILPLLKDDYLSHMVGQKYNATSNRLTKQIDSDNRPIRVSRNENLDRFVGYVFNSNGVADLGGIQLPQYLGDSYFAFLGSGSRYASWERWTITDEGRAIESIILREGIPGQPEVWIGTYEEI